MESKNKVEFSNLSQYNIEMVEKAIKSDKLLSNEMNKNISISYQYYDLAELSYKEMIKEETPATSYCRFASNAYGYQVYGFYKAIDGTIYIVDTYMENINNLYIPDKNIDCLKHIL